MKKTNKLLDNKSLEDMLSNQCGLINQQVDISSRSFAERNLPSYNEESIAIYFEENNLQFQILIDHINGELKFQEVIHVVKTAEGEANEKIRTIRNEANELQREYLQLCARLKSCPEVPSGMKLLIVRSVVLGIAIFEGLLSTPVFESWGFSRIESIAMGILFGGVIATFTHMVEWIVSLGKNPPQKKTISVMIFLFVTAIFTYMATARAGYFSSLAGEDLKDTQIYFSPIPFILISLLLFIVGVGLCIKYLPNKADRAVMKLRDTLINDKNDIETSIEAKQKAIENIKAELIQTKKECASTLVRGAMLEEMVINHAKSGFSIWKRQNLMYRKDNLKPICFDEKYPFSFTTYFHTIKTLNNESIN